jgi:hypothetical protein
MKIDIEKVRLKRQEKEEQSKREFELLKKKLADESTASVGVRTPITTGERSVKFSGGPKQESVMKDEVVPDDVQEEEDIEDHYEDVTDRKNEIKIEKLNKPKGLLMSSGTADDDIDFDYSQSHLEDFLRTHAQKNPHV